MEKNGDKNFNIFIIITIFGFLIIFVLVVVFTPFIVQKVRDYHLKRQKLKSQSDTLLDSDEDEDFEIVIKSISSEKSEIKCAIDYKNRNSQLLVGVSNLKLQSNIVQINSKLSDARFFLLAYLNGDVTNFPCESQSFRLLQPNIVVNEIFVFTTMPYDLQTTDIRIQAIVASGRKLYSVGSVKIPIAGIDPKNYDVSMSYVMDNSAISSQETINLEECLMCISVTNADRFFKLKIIRLFIINCQFPEDNITGLHARIKMTLDDESATPVSIVETSKKKYKSTLLFNETFMVDKLTPQSRFQDFSIQLMESRVVDNEEVVKICGSVIMNNELDAHSLTAHLTECSREPNTEFVRWHRISYY